MKDLLLVVHFVGLALGLGTGFAMMRLGASARELDPAERGKFMGRVLVLSKNASWGLVLLVVSGVTLFFTGGGMTLLRTAGWPFHTKLTLVVVLIVLFGMMQMTIAKLRKAAPGPEAQAIAAKLPKIGAATTSTSLLIVTMAVLSFH
jgi:uncharacterized membrane protein